MFVTAGRAGSSFLCTERIGKAVGMMAVFRVEKNANYTTISNYHLRDQELSLKAKGLLCLFLSLPEEWHYSVRGIASICKEGVDCIKNTLKELEKRGYLVRTQIRRADGRMGEIEYVIYEQSQTDLLDRDTPNPDAPHTQDLCTETPCAEDPHTGNLYTEDPVPETPCMENPITEEPHPENLHTEDPAQINKDQTNKEKRNTEKNKKRENKGPVRRCYGQYGNVLLSEKEREALMNEYPKDYQERIERLSEYMASTGKVYKNHLATIRSWAKRENGKPAVKPYDHANYECSEGESL